MPTQSDKKWWEQKPAEEVTTDRIVSLDKLRKKKEAAARDMNAKAHELKQTIIVAMMNGLKTRVIEADGWSVRVSQAEVLEYDDDAILSELSLKQRRLVTQEMIDLNELTPAVRKKIVDALTPAQRRAVTKVALDYEKLSQAVQTGEVDRRMVAKHTEIRQNAPYISASGPKGKSK